MSTDVHLDLPQDMNGNYILKQYSSGNEYNYNTFIKNTGSYKGCLLISTTFFKKKLKHSLDDIVKKIEDEIMCENSIKVDDLLYERFTLGIKEEQDFNPLFKRMNDTEIAEYTKNSKKVHIEIEYEFHIKPKSHLTFGGLINSLTNFKK